VIGIGPRRSIPGGAEEPARVDVSVPLRGQLDGGGRGGTKPIAEPILLANHPILATGSTPRNNPPTLMLTVTGLVIGDFMEAQASYPTYHGSVSDSKAAPPVAR